MEDKIVQITSKKFHLRTKDELTFILERIDNDEDAIYSWNRFVNREEQISFYNYCKLYRNNSGVLNRKGFLEASETNNNLLDGYVAMKTSLRKYSKQNELWIAYVTPVPIESIKKADIEMCMCVLTHPDCSFTVHMGINRCFLYLQREARKVLDHSAVNYYGPHKKLSMRLHAFAAKIMVQRGKTMMLSAPVQYMVDIFEKAFENDLFGALITIENPVCADSLYRRTATILYTKQNKKQKMMTDDDEYVDYNPELIKIPFIEEKIWQLKDQDPNTYRVDWTNHGKVLTIRNLDNQVVYKQDFEKEQVETNGKIFKGGGDTRQFDWVNHSDFRFAPYVLVDLEALADKMT